MCSRWFLWASLLCLAATVLPPVASAETLTCVESDRGNVSSKAGFARLKNAAGETIDTKADTCDGDVLREYYCSSGIEIREEAITCAAGCRNGACLPTSSPAAPSAASIAKRKARAQRLTERQRSFKRYVPSAKQMFYTFPGVRRRLAPSTGGNGGASSR